MITPLAKFKVPVYGKDITVYKYDEEEYKIRVRALCMKCNIGEEDKECIEVFNRSVLFTPEFSVGIGNDVQISVNSLPELRSIEDGIKAELLKFHANLISAIKSRYLGDDDIFTGMQRKKNKKGRKLPVVAQYINKDIGLAQKKVPIKKKTKRKITTSKTDNNSNFIGEMEIRKDIKKLSDKIIENHETVAKFLTLQDKEINKSMEKNQEKLAAINNSVTKILVKIDNLTAGRGNNNYNNELFTEVKKDVNTGFDQIWNKLDNISFPASVWEAASKIEFLSLNKPVKKRRWYFLWLF